MKIDDLLTSIIDGSIFISLIFFIHLLCSYHPYHRIFPLLIGNISFFFLAICINLFILNSNSSLFILLKESISNSIISIIYFYPFLFIFISFIIVKLFFRKRPEDPLLKLLD
ncbi:MAG: hypothetical protein CMA42_00360 [Euryarchaeota archaeon]|nr:hypothetical protein [Euryarchaeota archaeon]